MDAQYQSDDDVLERLEPDTPRQPRTPKDFQDSKMENDSGDNPKTKPEDTHETNLEHDITDQESKTEEESEEESTESEILPDPVQIEPSHNTAKFIENSMDIGSNVPSNSISNTQSTNKLASTITTQQIPEKLPGIAIIGESPGTQMLKHALQHCGFPIVHYMSESDLIMLKSAEASLQNNSSMLNSLQVGFTKIHEYRQNSRKSPCLHHAYNFQVGSF